MTAFDITKTDPNLPVPGQKWQHYAGAIGTVTDVGWDTVKVLTPYSKKPCEWALKTFLSAWSFRPAQQPKRPADTKRWKPVVGPWAKLPVGTQILWVDHATGRAKPDRVTEHTKADMHGVTVRNVVTTRGTWNADTHVETDGVGMQATAYYPPGGACRRCNGDGFVAPVGQDVRVCRDCLGHG